MSFVLIFTLDAFFTNKTGADVSTGSENKTVNIQFSNINHSLSCQLADFEHNEVYWIKLSKEVNGSYCDIVDVHKHGENSQTKWFTCTDLKSRSNNVGSSLVIAKLVLNFNSTRIQLNDNGRYKCEINTMKGVYKDTMEIDWRGGNHNLSIRHSESILLYLTAFLLAKSCWY
ncbi:unnamed protein product [Mytilus coruscus]|uniref:Ig-like domain-containing protein n=1 Tax=Mytilus coruscus TaxID=42192 RepID=A0A6J8DDM1_MYTCO|nr:unnamed protein product [Mytilus coruscus]